MPGRNIYKEYSEESYYHIYNRGVNKQPIFLDDNDKAVFLALLKRYLGDMPKTKIVKQQRPSYVGEIELLSFCLMKNHFHLFVYQGIDMFAITKFMRSLTTSYSMYFNKKYKRVGPVFQQRFRAVRITSDEQLLHISRYIHLNPKNYKDYEWSSYQYYVGEKKSEYNWLRQEKVLALFDRDYAEFMADYEDYKQDLDSLKSQLADSR